MRGPHMLDLPPGVGIRGTLCAVVLSIMRYEGGTFAFSMKALEQCTGLRIWRTRCA